MADFIRQKLIIEKLQSANCRLYNLLKEIKEKNSVKFQWSAILSIERDIREAKAEYHNEFFERGEFYD